MTISLFPPALFSQGRPLPEAAHRKIGQTLATMLLKDQQHSTGSWVWSWSKNIFADVTFRTSCYKSSASGSARATCKTQLWSSVARLGMPQADQTSCWSFLEASQHIQKVLPVGGGARWIYGTWGRPACISISPFSLPGAFCSSLNRGLCPMAFISNFPPVSTDYNLILPSDFSFNYDFMSNLPQPPSTPLFCVWHSVWQLRILFFCWISSHTMVSVGNPVELTGLGALSGHLMVAQCLRELQCHTGGFVCAPKGLAGSRAQEGAASQDSQRQQHGGEGLLPILLGVNPCPEQDPKTLQVVLSCTQE